MFLVPNEFSKCSILIECQKTNEIISEKLEYKINEKNDIVLGLGISKLSQIIDSKLLTLAEGDSSVIDITEFQLGIDLLKINLLSFTSATQIHELTTGEFLDRAHVLKSQGIESFKKNNFEAAFYLFSRSLKYLLCLTVEMKSTKHPAIAITSDQITSLNTLKCLCHLNLAACQLLGTNFSGAIENCDEALKIEPSNIKAFFRRGQAYMKLKEYESAVDDFKNVLKIEPNNKSVIKLFNEAKSNIKADNEQLSNKLKNLFN